MPWRFPFLGCFLARHGKFLGVAAHLLFGENAGVGFIRLQPLLQQLPAQQGKILNADSIAWSASLSTISRTF